MKKYLLFVVLLVVFNQIYATVDTVNIYSKYLHKQVKFVIIQPSQNTNSLPTVYLLHGYSGNYASWPG